MGLKSNEELIVELKNAIAEKNIGQAELMRMMDDAGHPIAKTTVQRFYKEGSEKNDSFRYKDTLQPMAEVLLGGTDGPDPIEELHGKIDILAERINELYEMASKSIAFMKSQIDLKDARMERKDAWVQELMDENKRLNDEVYKLLEKCRNCDNRNN